MSPTSVLNTAAQFLGRGSVSFNRDDVEIPSGGQHSPSARTPGDPRKRQRISRACDICHRRRVKCDGNTPCTRCLDPAVCTYIRGARKRGKPVRNGRGDSQQLSPSSPSDNDTQLHADLRSLPSPNQIPSANGTDQHRWERDFQPSNNPGQASAGDRFDSSRYAAPDLVTRLGQQPPAMNSNFLSGLAAPGINLSDTLQESSGSTTLRDLFPDQHVNQDQPNWESFVPSTAAPGQQNVEQNNTISQGLRYPVLKPLLPYIRSFLTASETCSLLECYFTSTFEDVFHPACAHIHAFIFRKSSVLDSKNPRKSSPALLASMLCVAAATDCDEMLSWPHRRLQSVRSKLYTLTIQLLKPLVHVDYGHPAVSQEDGSSTGDCGGTVPECAPTKNNKDYLITDATSLHEQGTLDDIVTYIHIAAVTSASERKAASMRWWHAAFTLARELKLHVEVSPKATFFPQQRSTGATIDPWTDWESFDFNTFTMDYTDAAASGSSPHGSVARQYNVLGEEEQEERRRTWWLLYIHDRHLALCYNRHLALTDAECSELLLPLDEAAWQSGRFLTSVDPYADRPGFPSVRCTGYTAFGFLLPLMTIMGEIIDHNHGKQHPFLGEQYRMGPHADALEHQIRQQLVAYKESLEGLESTQPASQLRDDAGIQPGQQQQQHRLHVRTVARYADFIIHVCYILLAGKCDPVSMFDDKDFWMLSPAFGSTKNHAIEAAEALNQILDVDPDLSFLPYFMGILLLQGSFVLLLVIDRLQGQTEPRIISACEMVIRATEACVATLDADYQRKYRQILRSAVMQARGRSIPERISKDRRRAVLALYRWTRNGTGLAI